MPGRLLALSGAVRAVSRAWHEGATVTRAPITGPSLETFGIDLRQGKPAERARRGTRELLQAYSDSPWVRAISKRVGEATASVEFELYRERGKRAFPGALAARIRSMAYDQRRDGAIRKLVTGGDIEVIEQHEVLDFLAAGNPYLNGFKCRTLAQIQYDLTGEAFALIERGKGNRPQAWYPIPPHWVVATPHPSGRDYFEVRPPGVGNPKRIPREEILWMLDPSVLDPFGRGSGIGTALADETDTDEFISKYLRNTFVNDAQPPFVVFGDGVTQEATAKLEQSWVERVGGFLKRNKPLFLSKKVEIKELGRTFQELQLIELRRWERDVSFTVWGVSPEWFGVIENSNRATIEAADYMVQSHVVVPRAVMQCAAINQQIMPLYGDESLVLGFRSPVPSDQEHRAKIFQMSPWAFRVDEHRDLAGEAALPGKMGQVFPSPLGLGGTPEPLGIDVEDLAQDEEPDDAEEAPEEDADEPADDDAAQSDDADEESEEEDATRRPIPDAKLADKAGDARRRDPVGAHRTRAPSDGPPILTPRQIAKVVRAARDATLDQALKPALRSVVDDFGRTTSARFGVDWNDASDSVLGFLREESATQVVRIGKTTRYKIRRALEAGTEEGESYDALAKRIGDVFKQSRGYRARAIARTESVRAANFGVHEGMKQAGIEKKQWLTTRGSGSRPRDAHLNLDGEILPIDQPFRSSTTGGLGQRPGDFPDAVDTINCRCTLLAIVDEQTEAASPLAKLHAYKRHEASRASAEGKIVRAARRGFTLQEAAVRRALEEVRP